MLKLDIYNTNQLLAIFEVFATISCILVEFSQERFDFLCKGITN